MTGAPSTRSGSPPEHRPAEPPRRLDLLVRSTPGQPAIVTGLRAAVATMVPLLISEVFHLGAAGTWGSLGGFSAAVADRGGVYRARALTMGALTVGAGIGVALGALVGGNGWIAVPLTFVVVWALSLLRAYGVSAGGIGSSIAVAFAISLTASAPALDALWRGVYLLAGGAWAMFLALVLWPMRPFRPLRLATARCYRELAEYADHVAREAEIAPDDNELLPPGVERRTIRDAIEEARAMVAMARRGGQGDARRGERLLVLVQGADVVFGTLIGLSELFETARVRQDAAGALPRAAEALRRFAARARLIADVVATEPTPPRATEGIATSRVTPPQPSDGETPAVAHLTRLLAQLQEYGMVLAANADGIESGRTPAIPSAIAVLTMVDDQPPVLETLRASFTMSSLAMRHALRVAIVTALAVLINRLFALPHGYWVTITAIIILQPYAGATTIKALQRVIGTVTGALLTVGLVALVQNPRGLLLVVFVLAAVCVAFLRINYLIYSIFLTPTFVLLAEMSAGDWHLAQLRALDTVIGGALGLAGAWLLWPAPERARFPELAAGAIRAAAAHLRVVSAMWTNTGEDSTAALAAARRDAALAVSNAEASFERLVAESTRSRRALEPGTTLLTFTRRLIGADIALGTLRLAPGAAALRDDIATFTRRLTSSLDAIADAVAAQKAPPPLDLPDVDTGVHADLTSPQFHRVLRQAEIVCDAAARLAAA